jgi:hypothetical protein
MRISFSLLLKAQHIDMYYVLSQKDISVIPQNYVVVSSLMLARLP